MKYLIFGCMLILLGIAAMKHESPQKSQHRVVSNKQISRTLSNAPLVGPPAYNVHDERSLAKFTSYPMVEPDSQLHVIGPVDEGG